MVESSAPTEAAGIADAETQSAYAWALDDVVDEPTRRLSPALITAGVVALSLLAIAGALTAWVKYRPAHEVPSVPTSTVVVAAPPPVVVTTVVQQPAQTITKQAPAPEKKPDVTSVNDPVPADSQFLANLGSRWEITDSKLATTRAHQVCGLLQRGSTRDYAVNQILSSYGGGPYQDWEIARAQDFVGTAMATYANCP